MGADGFPSHHFGRRGKAGILRDAIDGKTVHTWTHPEDPDIQVDYRLWTGPLYTGDMVVAAEKVWIRKVCAVRGIRLPDDVEVPASNVGLFWFAFVSSDICNAVVTVILNESHITEDERRD